MTNPSNVFSPTDKSIYSIISNLFNTNENHGTLRESYFQANLGKQIHFQYFDATKTPVNDDETSPKFDPIQNSGSLVSSLPAFGFIHHNKVHLWDAEQKRAIIFEYPESTYKSMQV